MIAIIMLAQFSGTPECHWQDGLCLLFERRDVYVTPAPLPKCPDGYQLVLDWSMKPICAKELVAPR